MVAHWTYFSVVSAALGLGAGVLYFLEWFSSKDYWSNLELYSVYLVFIALAAILSQWAEWSHLHFFDQDSAWWAFAGAWLLAGVEYELSVGANRLARRTLPRREGQPNYYLMSLIWNLIQLGTNLLLVRYLLDGGEIRWQQGLGFFLAAAGVALQYI